MPESVAGALAALASGGTILAALGAAQPREAVTTTQAPPDSLRFELVAPAQARAGEPVPIALRLTNVTGRPVELHLLGREIAFDIVVARDDGTVVWRRLAKAVVPGILRIEHLGPGETLELKDVWNQESEAGARVAPGDYVVGGMLPTAERGPLRTPTARLRIRAR